MGTSLQKEVVEFYSSSLTSPEEPNLTDFYQKSSKYASILCSGTELCGVASEVVEAALPQIEETGRFRWLLLACIEILQRSIDHTDESNAAASAVVHVVELVLRQVISLTKGKPAQLTRMLESRGGIQQTAEEPRIAKANATPAGGSLENVAGQFCCSLLTFVTQVAITETTVALYLEVLRLLLTLTSSALHHRTSPPEDSVDFFTEIILSSPFLHDTIIALLRCVEQWGAEAPNARYPFLYHEGYQPSIRNLYQLLGRNRSRSSADMPPYTENMDAARLKDFSALVVGCVGCGEQIGRHASALLCILTIYRRGAIRNPALEYIKSIQDGQPVSFVLLLSTIRSKVHSFPTLCILLYVLLYDHSDFLRLILSQDALLMVNTAQRVLELAYDTCLEPVPRGLQATRDDEGTAATVWNPETFGRMLYTLRGFSFPFINFMVSTLLLLLSQDRVVNKLLCDTPCLSGCLLDHHAAETPVGAVTVVVLVLGITRGLNDQNEPLAAMFAPSLVNLAPFVHDMNSYTSQRVVGVLVLLLKKIKRVAALLPTPRTTEAEEVAGTPVKSEREESKTEQNAQPTASANGATVDPKEVRVLEELLQMYMRQLRVLVEAVEAFLRGPNRCNERLIYELLYVRNKIIDDVECSVSEGRVCALQTKEVLRNLVEMIRSCEADIASEEGTTTTQGIIDMLRRGQNRNHVGDGSNTSRGEGSTKNGKESVGGSGEVAGATSSSIDLVYSYEESPFSYDFFGPFLWATLLSACQAPGGALWCRQACELALFPH